MFPAVKKWFTTILVGLLLTGSHLSAEESPRRQQESGNRKTARDLLEDGSKQGTLPAGTFVRVSAYLYHAKEHRAEEAKARGETLQLPFEEHWEFTPTEVHRVVYDSSDKKNRVYRRVAARPFDSKTLSKQLIDGRFLEIGTGKGKGAPQQYIGSDYELGGRSIELFRGTEAEPLVNLHEHCTGAGYPESDARAFGELYEQLAAQARQSFKSEQK